VPPWQPWSLTLAYEGGTLTQREGKSADNVTPRDLVSGRAPVARCAPPPSRWGGTPSLLVASSA
jgi:hypothetical protein